MGCAALAAAARYSADRLHTNYARPGSSTGPAIQRAMASPWRAAAFVAVFLMGLNTGICDKDMQGEQAVHVSMDSLVQLRGVEECDLGETEALKVYVYDLPFKFHFGLFSDKDVESLPQKPDKPVHMPYRRRDDGSIAGRGFEHSAEAYVTFDLLYPPKVTSKTTMGNEVVRVDDPSTADVFFVPFLASLSFNRFSVEGMHSNLTKKDQRLQEELEQILRASKWWQRSGGHDHVLGMVQPNAIRFVRDRLASAMFLVADFGRCDQSVSRLSKDVVVPYNHMLPTFLAESAEEGEKSWARRTTLLYFQGTVKRKNEGYVRKLLHDELNGQPGVHFASGRGDPEGMRSAAEGMRGSRFCLHVAGDTPSSCRLFDAIVSQCVPVIISNKLELPFEFGLDYSSFSLFLSHAESLREGHLLRLLRNMTRDEWVRRWRRLLEVQAMFEFQVPSQKGDATSMVWRAVRNRLPQIRRNIHVHQRQVLAAQT